MKSRPQVGGQVCISIACGLKGPTQVLFGSSTIFSPKLNASITTKIYIAVVCSVNKSLVASMEVPANLGQGLIPLRLNR